MSNQKKEILQAGQVINILYKYEQGKGAFINIKSPTSKEELEERLFLLDIISNYLPSLKNDLLFTHQIAKILSNLFEEYIFIVDSYKQKIPVIQIDYYEICENCTIRNNFNEIDLFNRHGKEKIPIEILKCRNKEKSSKIYSDIIDLFKNEDYESTMTWSSLFENKMTMQKFQELFIGKMDVKLTS